MLRPGGEVVRVSLAGCRRMSVRLLFKRKSLRVDLTYVDSSRRQSSWECEPPSFGCAPIFSNPAESSSLPRRNRGSERVCPWRLSKDSIELRFGKGSWHTGPLFATIRNVPSSAPAEMSHYFGCWVFRRGRFALRSGRSGATRTGHAPAGGGGAAAVRAGRVPLASGWAVSSLPRHA